MMTAVTFGEFTRQANERLAAALTCQPGQADPVAVARELRRVIGPMARCLDDRAPRYAIESLSTVDMPPWQRAVVDARTALRWAASSLPDGAATASGPEPGAGEVLAGCLAEAAASMMASRDLLHTHLTLGLDGSWEDRSAWALAVTSLPVTRALTGQIIRWSGQVALVAARLAAVCTLDPRTPAGLVEGLQGAAQWLWLAQVAVQPAQAAEPATDEDHQLLSAIPVARSLRRVIPDGTEEAEGLCAGIAVSAERLRTAAMVTAERSRWVPVSADTWRWSALAAAVIGQAGEHLLRSLASRPGIPPSQPAQLQQAADGLRRASLAWRQVAADWEGVATGARGLTSPVVTEIGDLVLRMGRLAWDDPHWTPARQHPAPASTSSNLAVGARQIVSAVHQAADALAQLTAADAVAVTSTDRMRRLYVLTRTLPEGYDVPRRYAPAPLGRTSALLDAYTTAAQASTHASAMLAGLALAVDAPSSTLALARAACTSHHPALPASSEPLAAAIDCSDRTAPHPGPVEQMVHRLRVDDPAILLRAAAIDQAARQLIAQAEQAPRRPIPSPVTIVRAAQQLTVDSPSQLAGQDSPHRPAAILARGQRQGSARPAARPSSQSRPVSPRRPSQYPRRKLTS